MVSAHFTYRDMINMKKKNLEIKQKIVQQLKVTGLNCLMFLVFFSITVLIKYDLLDKF